MVSQAFKLIDFENPVFAAYAFWSAVLALKMFFMSANTAFYRFKNGAFANIEDVAGDKKKVRFNDDQVERVRRAHRNDLENILPGFLLGFLFVLTNPSPLSAALLFKVGALARIIHTVVYSVFPIPQPARVLSWAVAYLINIYMAVAVVIYLF